MFFAQNYLAMCRHLLANSLLSVVVTTLLCVSLSEGGNVNQALVNRKVEFSMSCNKNETGHLLTDFSLKKTSPELPKSWRLNVEHGATEIGGVQTFHMRGVLVANPPVPAGYQLFHGIGYYKFHRTAVTFDEASATCASEGSHLVIINSDAEADVVKTLFQANKDAGLWASVGIHDRLKEGEFMTIFGQPLASTGFQKWNSPAEPNGGRGENCGSVVHSGLLNDKDCDSKNPFICEYDLTWSES